MAKQLYPNIVRGGMAIPLGNNYYFMKGRKHNQGGIDIGKDLEVEGGEIMKLDENNVKVFSAVPFLNGQSPVEKILGGENPNKVFAQQERFKKVNKINDDGTKAKYGKRKINTETIPESEQYAVTISDKNNIEDSSYIKRILQAAKNNLTLNLDVQKERFYNHFDPYIPYTNENIKRAVELFVGGPEFAKKEHYKRQDIKPKIFRDGYLEGAADTLTDAIWATYLGIPKEKRRYNSQLEKSEYKPTKSPEYNKYYKLPLLEDTKKDLIQQSRKLKFGENEVNDILFGYNMGYSTIGRGLDYNKGEYVSYADTWDINPLHGAFANNNYKDIPIINKLFYNKGKDIFRGITNPIPFYDRIYLDDYYNVNSAPKNGDYYGGYLPEITVTNNENNQYKYGGKMNRQKAPFGKGETYIQESNKNVKPNSPFRTKEDEKVSYLNRLYYSKINPLHGYPQGYIDAATNPLYLQALIEGRKTPNEMTYIVEDSVGDAAWRKRLGLSYDKKFLIDNGDGSVKLHKNRENEIPVDTNLYINRINSSKDAIKRITKQIDEINTKKYNGTFDKNDEEDLKYLLEDRSLINAGINVDKETLEALRKTYKTGKAVTVNEFGYNSRSNSIAGDSPLNMLQNYGIQYDKNKNVMRYFDTYDFNQFDPFVPGKPFDFKGEIKLNKKQLGGKANIYRLDSNGKSGLRMNISTGDETKARKKALLGKKEEANYYGVLVDDIERQKLNELALQDKIDTNTYMFHNYNPNYIDRKINTPYDLKEKIINGTNPYVYSPQNKAVRNYNLRKNINKINPENIKINYSQGLKDYLKNATTIKPSINWNKIGTAIKPYAGSIIDTVGNIATSLINASTLNKMKYTKQPIPQIANKLKTSVNINPQLKTLNESYNQYTDYINNNTASSKVAREALQRARIKNVLDTNTLYATKENTETELINKDRINQQTVANANVDNYNKWLAGKAEFNNAILDKKSENIVGAINNITSSFNTSINNIKKDRQFNNNLISVLAANPNVNPEYLRALGADWVTDKMIKDWKLANKKK